MRNNSNKNKGQNGRYNQLMETKTNKNRSNG